MLLSAGAVLWFFFTSWPPWLKSQGRGWSRSQNDCTYGHSKEKGGIPACISSTLKRAMSIYICNLFSCCSSSVEEFDLLSEFSGCREGPLSAPCLTPRREGAHSEPSASAARIEILQVPSLPIPGCELHMASRLKRVVKG